MGRGATLSAHFSHPASAASCQSVFPKPHPGLRLHFRSGTSALPKTASLVGCRLSGRVQKLSYERETERMSFG